MWGRPGGAQGVWVEYGECRWCRVLPCPSPRPQNPVSPFDFKTIHNHDDSLMRLLREGSTVKAVKEVIVAGLASFNTWHLTLNLKCLIATPTNPNHTERKVRSGERSMAHAWTHALLLQMPVSLHSALRVICTSCPWILSPCNIFSISNEKVLRYPKY